MVFEAFGSNGMSDSSMIEQRLTKLEADMAELKRQNVAGKKDWFSVVAGSFKNDPEFAEIVGRAGKSVSPIVLTTASNRWQQEKHRAPFDRGP